MPVYLSPGVYIEEIPSGSKPIEAVSTSTAAFVGAPRKGPTGEAVLIHSLDEYRDAFGEIVSETDAMGLAVQAFYMNGGKDAYICRLMSDDSDAASISLAGQATSSAAVLRVEASSVGEWGNDLYVRLVKPDQHALTFDLEVGHRDKGKFVRDELFSGLSMDAQDDDYALTRVNGNSRYVALSLEAAADPTESGEQYDDAMLIGGKGAGPGFDAALGAGSWTMTLNINDLGAKQITINGGLTGTAVATAITNAVKALGTDPAYQSFAASYSVPDARFSLTSPKASARDKSSASVTVYEGTGTSDLAAALRLDSRAKARLAGGSLAASNDTLFSHETTGVLGIAGAVTLALTIDGRDPVTIQLDKSKLGLTANNKDDGEAVARAIRDAVRALDSRISSYKDFDVTYEDVDSDNRRFVLTSGSGASPGSSITVAGGALADLLGLSGGTTLTPGREYKDATARVIPQQDLGIQNEGVQLKGGSEARASAAEYGDFFQNVLRKVRDASILLLPGQTWAANGSGNAYISEALAHCEATKNRMVIIDPPGDAELEQAAQVDEMALPTSTYAVLYYPWIKVGNPLYDEDKNPNAARTVLVAPSGFAAGMWAKIDGTRGVWKAPAGVETQLLGVAGLGYIVEEGEQDQLNPLGVNAIRKLPSYGSVIWGSRTLATKAKPEWRYVPVRRTAIFIERSLYEGIQWAVFEPNDHPLWSSLRANIESFMTGLFRAGAFQGAKASDAFFVRCGLGDTMTQGDIDRGQVIVVVGFAPLKPAEFVIVRIQQKVGQQ